MSQGYAELAALTGRHKSNLSRTLKGMERTDLADVAGETRPAA
jgi:predicted transcriptional regulator